MARDDDTLEKPSNGSAGIVMPGGRPSATPMRHSAFAARSAAELQRVAEQLGVPVEQFFPSTIIGEGEVAPIDADRPRQERRLLSAFNRIVDRELRNQVVALAEALAPSP